MATESKWVSSSMSLTGRLLTILVVNTRKRNLKPKIKNGIEYRLIRLFICFDMSMSGRFEASLILQRSCTKQKCLTVLTRPLSLGGGWLHLKWGFSRLPTLNSFMIPMTTIRMMSGQLFLPMRWRPRRAVLKLFRTGTILRNLTRIIRPAPSSPGTEPSCSKYPMV